MNYSKFIYPDVANGTGCRVSLFLTGCTLHCKNCFNSEIWDFNSGKKFTEKSQIALISALALPYIDGLSVLGGEPTDQGDELIELLRSVKKHFPEKDIWMWSGRTMEELIESGRTKCLEFVDVLVDGPFIEEEKELNLEFRGSKNQHIWKKTENTWYIWK